MRVSDNERRRLPVIARGPLVDDARDRGSDMSFTCAGVDQESLLATKEKIQEGLLIIDAAVFPQNVEIGIVSVNLPFRRIAAGWPSRTPGLGKFAGSNATAIRLGSLRPKAAVSQQRAQGKSQ